MSHVHADSSQWMLNSRPVSHYTARGMNPAEAASARKSSTVYFQEHSCKIARNNRDPTQEVDSHE